MHGFDVAKGRERLRVEGPAPLEVGDGDAGAIDQSEVTCFVRAGGAALFLS
jgi:hypothetical protein